MGTSCVTIIEYSKLIDINFVFHFNIDAEVNFLLPMSPISSVSHQADPPPPCTHANTHTSRPRPRRALYDNANCRFHGRRDDSRTFCQKTSKHGPAESAHNCVINPSRRLIVAEMRETYLYCQNIYFEST